MTKQSVKCIHGQRFGRLVVIKEADGIYWGKYKHRQFLCQCDCGNKTIVRLEYLRNGHTQSCGCNRLIISSKSRLTHGGTKSRLYRIWTGMLRRCRNSHSKDYGNYGGRGIVVCDEWFNFEPFRDWALANGYADSLTIDRKDVNGNYEPNNCKWSTMLEQRHNRRDSVAI